MSDYTFKDVLALARANNQLCSLVLQWRGIEHVTRGFACEIWDEICEQLLTNDFSFEELEQCCYIVDLDKFQQVQLEGVLAQ